MMTTIAATTATLVTFGWSWLPPGPCAYFDRSETRTIANAQAFDIVGIIAPLIAGQPQIAALIAAESYNIKSWATHANNSGKCLKLTASGLLFGDEYTGGNCR